ncbi:serine carboxypeptidase-like 40 [Andrographis paniculata]|uniref:serine carboxypeptidase-like 40 n=1 Tax=Andrographis paniculata TaxID=175694 RepID=UPI0021E94699|nr:serine carboxypeptidase-like 40 [Andrographis paniculata]
MDFKAASAAIVVVLMASHFKWVLEIDAKKHNDQIKALSHIYQEKFQKPNGIDQRHFNGSHSQFQAHKLIHPQKNIGQKEKDFIPRLPGQPAGGVPFKQYGGYVAVDPAGGRALYYYFVEAQHPKKSPSQLPLLLWLNGGPGCSSLAYGAMDELGPFRVHSDGKTLYKNNFAWNYAANVLFLESPAGVGFSYSNTTKDYEKSGDRNTAKDNYAFLLNWFERFPEYKGRDFYISGESYAGHYVPQLAHVVHRNNLRANKTIINLKGIIIGNAVIDDEMDTKGMFEFFESHALVSEETTEQIFKYCNFSPKAIDQSTRCNTAYEQINSNIDDIDIYNIYAPLCSNPNVTKKPKRISDVSDPCSDNYIFAYLNRADVQKALHANVTKLDYYWQPCSDIIKNWRDSPTTVIPLLKEFLADGLRVWIFSGDIDGRIPVTSTKKSIKKMNLDIKVSWHPWFVAGEVGGYTQVYEKNMTFATVRGAGHQVPSYQPQRALSLIMHFLDGTQLPNSDSNYK